MNNDLTFTYDSSSRLPKAHIFDIGHGQQLRMEAVQDDIARICMTDISGKAMVMPNSVTCRTEDGTPVPCHDNEFYITWLDSYVIMVNGADMILIAQARQQSIQLAPGVSHIAVQ